MLTIVHLLGPESNSHSHILTVSTQQVNRKMLQVQKTLYASNLQSFIEIQPRISRLHCCGRTTLAPGNPSSVKKRQPRVLTRSRLPTPEGGSDTEGDLKRTTTRTTISVPSTIWRTWSSSLALSVRNRHHPFRR